MYGFGFNADHTGRAVGDQFVVYRQAFCMGERCNKSLGVVRLVHYEANEVVIPSLFVKIDGIEELH